MPHEIVSYLFAVRRDVSTPGVIIFIGYRALRFAPRWVAEIMAVLGDKERAKQCRQALRAMRRPRWPPGPTARK